MRDRWKRGKGPEVPFWEVWPGEDEKRPSADPLGREAEADKWPESDWSPQVGLAPATPASRFKCESPREIPLPQNSQATSAPPTHRAPATRPPHSQSRKRSPGRSRHRSVNHAQERPSYSLWSVSY